MLATTNAVNLTDGIDGLSTSVTTIIITCLTVIGIMFGVKEVTVFGTILIGACLGFLIFNSHPAKVFMGDTGSLSLGGLLATIAILTNHEILLIVVSGVFVLETLSVAIQVTYFKITKKMTGVGKRFFKMAPLHHHFEKIGWIETDIVKLFWTVGIFLGMLSIVYGVWI